MPIPSGIIIIWSGALVDIPDGWSLCDGTLGTPNLRNKFLVGAGDTYNPGDTGGAVSHTHDFTGDGHSHNLVGMGALGSGTYIGESVSVTAVTGTTVSASNFPPYYSLAYIMKI